MVNMYFRVVDPETSELVQLAMLDGGERWMWTYDSAGNSFVKNRALTDDYLGLSPELLYEPITQVDAHDLMKLVKPIPDSVRAILFRDDPEILSVCLG